MAKAISNVFYNSLAGCSHPSVSSVAPYAVTATFSIYEAGAYLSFVTEGCIQKPVYTGTLAQIVDLSGVLPLFLSSEGIKYDYPALVLTTPTIGYIVASCIVNGATVEFSWYQRYDQGASPPPGYNTWAATDGSNIAFTNSGTNWLVPLEGVVAGFTFLYGGDDILLKYSGSFCYRSTDFGANWTAVTGGTSNHHGVYIEDRFWLVGSNELKYSLTGASGTWVSVPVTMYGAVNAVGGHTGVLVVGDNAGRVRVSFNNGATFTGLTDLFGGSYVTAIGSNGTRIVIASSAGAFAYTDDGLSFITGTTPYPPGSNSTSIAKIVYGNNRWVAVTPNLALGQNAYSVLGDVWLYATGTDGFSGSDVVYSDAYSANLFVAVGLNGQIKTSTNGESWVSASNNFNPSFTITSVVARQEQFP
jgi:hypothetical protein